MTKIGDFNYSEDQIKSAKKIFNKFHDVNGFSLADFQHKLMLTEEEAKPLFDYVANDTKPDNLTLLTLFHDKSLFTKVVSLMQRHESYDFIIKYLSSKGKSISKGSLSNLKTKMTEAEEKGIPLENVLDKRKKTSIKDIGKKNIVGYTGKEEKINPVPAEILTDKKPISNQEVFEKIIAKGLTSLETMDFIDSSTTLKAADLNQKYFGVNSNGLTAEGIRQYQLIMQAELKGIALVIATFVPDNKQDAAFKLLDSTKKQKLNEIGKSDSGKRILTQLKKSGINI